MLVAMGKPRYLGRTNIPGGPIIHSMRQLFALVVLLLAAIGPVSAQEINIVPAPEDVNAVNLTSAVDIRPSVNGKLELSTAPGEDGIIRRIGILASQNGTNPNWGVFALRNDSD